MNSKESDNVSGYKYYFWTFKVIKGDENYSLNKNNGPMTLFCLII